jgi:hypothetical protein
VTSNWIHDQLAIGESVKVSGAYGTFIGDPSVDTPVLCIAAGTGLAPCWPGRSGTAPRLQEAGDHALLGPHQGRRLQPGHDGLVAHQAPPSTTRSR